MQHPTEIEPPIIKTEIKTEIKVEATEYCDQSLWNSIKVPESTECDLNDIQNLENAPLNTSQSANEIILQEIELENDSISTLNMKEEILDDQEFDDDSIVHIEPIKLKDEKIKIELPIEIESISSLREKMDISKKISVPLQKIDTTVKNKSMKVLAVNIPKDLDLISNLLDL